MPQLTFGGGLNQQDDINVDLRECVEGENFLLDKDGQAFRPRPPFDTATTTAGAETITGLLQLIKRDSTATTLVVASQRVYSYYSPTSTATVASVTTDNQLRDTYWSLDDFLVITDLKLNNVLKKWDGTTWSRLRTAIGGGTTKVVASLTRASTTATATVTAHGYSTGNAVIIAGANETGYLGSHLITVTGVDAFTFTVASATTSPATGSITAELEQDIYAKYGIVHLGRIWLFNIKAGSTTYPHMMLASTFENAEDFSLGDRAQDTGLTGSEAFFMLTPDLKPINGVAKFFETVLISTTNGRLFRLSGVDSTDFQIDNFYAGSSAISNEAMVQTGNDVMYMRNGGAIESLKATQNFGDVEADDLSRWIPDAVSTLTESLAAYDQRRQYVYWFVSGGVLVLDKTIQTLVPDLSPWSVWTTQHASGFTTLAAKYMLEPGGTVYSTYWGDNAGHVFKLFGTSDDGDADANPILTFRKSRLITDINVIDDILEGRILYRRRGECDLQMMFEWAENYADTSILIPLKDPIVSGGTGFWGSLTDPWYWGGTHYWSEGGVSQDRISTAGWSTQGKGPGFFVKMSLNTAIQFLINRLDV